MIYSIGYSKWTLAQVRRVMEEKGIELLVDVRSAPYSRFNPEFNRPGLMRALGTRYLWKGKCLGGKPGPATEEGIDWLEEQHASGRTVAIMCVEMDPANCHRLTDIAFRLYVRSIDVVHLIHDGTEHATSSYTGD